MSGKIRLLSDEVIGKIAAGEVVERPAAAIKEMVENSLDAGATAVTVEIRDGGISYIRVTDNGTGIQQSEIRMAFERHATSKISTSQELSAIQTLGFRGEALASIAAVARVTCTTRTKADTSGIKVVNAGGRIESIEETACPEGTTFVVRDLFFNTPVRLKFLKKPVTEAGYVSDLMMRLILSRPDVSFRYISQGKTLYHSAGDGKLSSAVFSIYGKEMRTLQEIRGHEAGVIVNGYVGVGDNARANRNHQSFFINGRYMKSNVLTAAVENACRERLPQNRYPSCVMHLTMPFEMVDVNVHPNKLECRFQNDGALLSALESIIRDAFLQQNVLDKPALIQLAPASVEKTVPVVINKQTKVENRVSVVPAQSAPDRKAVTPMTKPVQKPEPPIPSIDSKPSMQLHDKAKVEPVKSIPSQPVRMAVPTMKPLQPINRSSTAVLRQTPAAVQAYMQSYQDAPARQNIPVAAPIVKAEQPEIQSFLPEAKKELRIIGAAFNSYIVVEYNEHLLLIDQQGVHERLLFDRMRKLSSTDGCSQELLVPIIQPASRREQQLLEENQDLLKSIGLTVEVFGENEVAIRSIPMILGQPQTGSLLREIIDQLESERGVISIEKRRNALLALACKKAVRRNEWLSEDDLRELVVRMVDNNVTPTSPRGTPLIVALSHSELDRRFRRLQ